MFPSSRNAARMRLRFEVIPAEVPSKAENQAGQSSQPKRTRKIYWPAGLIASGAIIVVIFVLGTRYWKQFEKQKSSLEKQKSRSRRSLVSVAHQQQANLVLCGRIRSCLPFLIPR